MQLFFVGNQGLASLQYKTYIVPDDLILKSVHGFFHICLSDLISHDSFHWSQNTFNKKDLVFPVSKSHNHILKVKFSGGEFMEMRKPLK